MKKCIVSLTRIQSTQSDRDRSSVDTVLWRVKTPNSLSPISSPDFNGFTPVASVSSAAGSPHPVLDTVVTPAITSTVTIASTVSDVATNSTATTSATATGVSVPVIASVTTIPTLTSSASGFVLVNSVGEPRTNVTAAEMEISARNHSQCLLLSRVISAELQLRCGTLWPHSVWTTTGLTTRSFIVRTPNPLRSPTSAMFTGIDTINFRRVHAVLRVLETEYDFTLDLY